MDGLVLRFRSGPVFAMAKCGENLGKIGTYGWSTIQFEDERRIEGFSSVPISNYGLYVGGDQGPSCHLAAWRHLTRLEMRSQSQ